MGDVIQGRIVTRRPSELWTVVTLSAVLAAGCATTTTRPTSLQTQSWTDKVGASVKSGTEKLSAALSPKPDAPSQPGPAVDKKPGPAVFVAMAEVHERSGNIEEAETQLRKALAVDPNHLGALLAYAHLEDRQRNFEAATKYYQRALRKHPKNATVHNDMGLCFHRRGKLDDAAKALRQAVELEPHKKLYRDNLAAVLVDQGKTPEALTQLKAAHGEAVGNYNLGYLLVQKKDAAGALHHFQRAAQLDPSLTQAREWIAHLAPGMPPAPGQSAPMVAQRPPQAPYTPGSIATDAPYARREPPVTGPASYATAPAGQRQTSRRLPPQGAPR
jgi:Tfp pilus assembly protein PilF